ncbi:MAG: ABC transporter substrate-binding protein [Gammaproteobacteria bacterium]|nr:MAG: ABC transporter substrate-binding protein [Gammaproteobacteria bacterium]
MLKHFSVLIFAFILLGCNSEQEDSVHSKSIVYCAEGSPETFNPQLITSGTTVDATSKQLYDRLMRFDPKDNSIIPSLAKSWHITRDEKMLTFYLRKDVEFNHTDYFTPTRKMNADDVLFSFNRILDENHPYHFVSGGKYPFFQTVKFKELVKEVEKINDYTVRFKLNHPDSSFLTNLATDFSVILSAEYAEQLTKTHQQHLIDTQPIGTGPFKLKEFRNGSFIRFYRNENYWLHPVKIEQLLYDITPLNTARLTKLLAKECDVISYPIAHKKIIEHQDFTLDSVTSFNVGYLGFNVTKPPLDNILVRKAISHAINFKAIIHIIYGDQAQLAKSILPESSWAHTNTTAEREYSVQLAKSLLEVAGFQQGFTLDLWAMPIQRAYNPNALKMAKLIQQDLSHIGIKVNVISYEWNTFLRRLALGEHEAVLIGWSADHPDPDNFFTPILSCAARYTGGNRSFWCNKEYDELLKKALATTNIKQRKKYYAKALTIIDNEIPLIPIAHSKRYQARIKSVKGKILKPFGGIDFSSVSKVKNSANIVKNEVQGDD